MERFSSRVGLLGLAVRLGYVFIYQYHVFIGGDSFYYHYGANLLADRARASSSRTTTSSAGWTVQAAEHPPLYIVLLGAESWIGLHTYPSTRSLTCIVDTATIFIIGYTARELFGKGAGIFAAVIVAIYPYFWFNDGGVLSEGVAQTDHRAHRPVGLPAVAAPHHEIGRACSASVIALATLSRAEAILLPVLLVLPLVLFMKRWRGSGGSR